VTYKTIAVHLDDSDISVSRLAFAISIAKSVDAYLVGIYLPDDVQATRYELLRRWDKKALLPAIPKLQSTLQNANRIVFDQQLSLMQMPGTWMAVHSFADIERQGRLVDLVILGQPDPDEERLSFSSRFAQRLILSLGVPVLLSPFNGASMKLGAEAMVAWDGSGEASRAMHDAVPLLLLCKNVTVVTVQELYNSGRHHLCTPDCAVSALLRHGVKNVSGSVAGIENMDTGTILWSRIADACIDFIVMGAYGKGRTRERVLGGVTQTLIEEATVPVLFSH
jgi:nucleotide-binding universal stress UspA family protein